MGIMKSSCYASGNNTKTLTLDGRIQEYSSVKELIRQLPFAISADLVANRDWVFQRTLTSTSSSAIFPVGASSQFYCPTTAPATRNKAYNSTEGSDNSDNTNQLQPNFIFIATDSPVKVTFGYSPDPYIWRDPNDVTYSLLPQPVFAGGGSGATGTTAVDTSGAITGVTVTAGGSGYLTGTSGTSAVTYNAYRPGGSTNATGIATITTGAVVSVTGPYGTSGAYGTNYNPGPTQLNKVVLVNGYYVKDMSKAHIKVAPGTSGEMDHWNAGVVLNPSSPYPSWTAQGGESDGAITFPIYVEKTSQVTQAHILIYAAVLSI